MLLRRVYRQMENDFAATVQKYFLFLLIGIALFALIGAVIFIISSML